MIRLAGLIFLALAPAAFAETVPIRSGEHDGFSRLVLPFERATKWTVERNAREVVVAFDRDDMRFDLGKVFYYIPRDRLDELKTDPGALRLTLQCDCEIETFLVNPTTLVVDIKDAEAETAEAPQAPLATTRPENLKRPPIQIFSGADGPGAPAVPTAPTADPERLSEMQDALLNQLGRAAAQGLVDADVQRPVPKTAHSDMGSGARPDRKATEPVPEQHKERVHVSTAVDRGRDAAKMAPVTTKGHACFPDRYYDVARWGDDRSPAELISDSRRGLVSELDTPSTEAIADVVRGYLHLGFGAEALAVLKSAQEAIDGRAHFIALAHIMDDGHLADPTAFRDQLGCDSKVSLWALLAHETPPRGEAINGAAIQRTFSGLPLHLRRMFGPRLAGLFLDADDEEMAERVQNAVHRAPGSAGAQMELVNARRDFDHGESKSAEARLDKLLPEDTDLAARALLLKLRKRFETGVAPSLDDVVYADSLAFENRGNALGYDLTAAAVRGYAQLAEFRTALEGMAEVPFAAHPELPSQVFGILAEMAADETFLEFAYRYQREHPIPSLQDPARSRTVLRLVALGFANKAEAYLGGPPQSPEDHALAERVAQALGGAALPQEHAKSAGLTSEEKPAHRPTSEEDPQADVAASGAQVADPEGFTLSQAGNVLRDSEATRSAIARLLQQ